MQKIKCIIVDDEPLALGLLEKHVSQMPNLELIASCQNAMDAFAILKEQSIDLIFLDIQMPGLTGIDFVKSLQNPPAIIFTTAYRNYAIESYELDVLDYLLKPITFQRFFKAVNKFKIANTNELKVDKTFANIKEDSIKYIFVNANKKKVKIEFDKILFIESLKDYVRIHLQDQKVMTKSTISSLENQLPVDFLRVHRSFIINKKQVSAYTKHDIEIGEIEIPIGGSYKDIVVKSLLPK